MKCPLFVWAVLAGKQVKYMDDTDCLKENCARYDDRFQQCVDITTAEQLRMIATALRSINKDMPTHTQFTK